MSPFFLFAAAVSIDGPDLQMIDRAVAKCDAKVMTATFAEEPQRRRAIAIAAFNEQQDIVATRRAIAARRFPPAPAITPLPVSMPSSGANGAAEEHADLDRQAQQLAQRQQELDDARMLSAMRDQVLDLMRQQYVSKCSAGRQP